MHVILQLWSLRLLGKFIANYDRSPDHHGLELVTDSTLFHEVLKLGADLSRWYYRFTWTLVRRKVLWVNLMSWHVDTIHWFLLLELHLTNNRKYYNIINVFKISECLNMSCYNTYNAIIWYLLCTIFVLSY